MILFLRYLGNRILLVLSRRGPGLHTEALSYLLAEMQSVHRAHPGAAW